MRSMVDHWMSRHSVPTIIPLATSVLLEFMDTFNPIDTFHRLLLKGKSGNSTASTMVCEIKWIKHGMSYSHFYFPKIKVERHHHPQLLQRRRRRRPTPCLLEFTFVWDHFGGTKKRRDHHLITWYRHPFHTLLTPWTIIVKSTKTKRFIFWWRLTTRSGAVHIYFQLPSTRTLLLVCCRINYRRKWNLHSSRSSVNISSCRLEPMVGGWDGWWGETSFTIPNRSIWTTTRTRARWICQTSFHRCGMDCLL